MKLLLHTCCGPCFLGVWEDLKTSDFEVTNYFYNPNIQPEDEYKLRLENLRKVVSGKTEGILEEEYDATEHLNAVKGHEEEFPERCMHCYILRLNQTAKKAKDLGFDAFSTTLLVSPYQKHEELAMIGRQVGEKYGVKFYYRDWRPYFREGQNVAKEMELYRQKYCGCIFSRDENSSK